VRGYELRAPERPQSMTPALMCSAMGDLAARIAFLAIGALFLHDAVWWQSSWFFGNLYNHWWKRQSELAQGLYRMWLGFFGSLMIFAALFGTVVHGRG
jgi:hypothetical protein